LKEINNRKARFRTVISLVIDGNEKQFEGIVEGEITRKKKAAPDLATTLFLCRKVIDKTFAEMSMEEKNQISHRARAVQKLVEYLHQIENS
jgi:XTP/dITP diphosphohydrolase